MSTSSLGMALQDREGCAKFENELERLLKASNKAGIIFRLIRSFAFQMHCQKYRYLQSALGRAYTDIDLAAFRKQFKEVQA